MKSNSILFGTPPLKAQNNKICQIFLGAWPLWPPLATPMLPACSRKNSVHAFLSSHRNDTEAGTKKKLPRFNPGFCIRHSTYWEQMLLNRCLNWFRHNFFKTNGDTSI